MLLDFNNKDNRKHRQLDPLITEIINPHKNLIHIKMKTKYKQL